MYWEAWGALEKGVRTGEAAFEHAHGTTHFTYLEDHPEEAHVFHNGMRSLSSQVYAAVIRAYDFSQFRTVIDVGGGQGVLLAEILNAHPSLRGILFDSSSAVEQSVHVLQTAGVTDRCEAVSGDFFANIPAGADAVILSRILHNWDDADALRILKNCRLALPSGGKLIIVEYVITDDAAGLSAKLFDLQMLVYFGRARERSEAEYQSLLQGAGFSLARVVHTSATIAVIEAVAENRPM
jgi:ubiquinone/menaquinone biosynthesis C-methylase UbiE